MRVFINGATGFVGRHVVFELLRRGHEVVAGVRDVQRAQEVLGVEVSLLAMNDDSRDHRQSPLITALEGCDAIITLAGSPIFHAATASGLQACRQSRIDTSQTIVNALRHCSKRPKAWVATSAIGIYSSQASSQTGEGQSGLVGDPGTGSANTVDALMRMCMDWEKVATKAEEMNLRVARMRLAAVLGRDGGTWRQLRRSVLPKIGVVVGSGDQWFSWVHVRDVARIYADALEDECYQGPIDVVAPELVTQRQIMNQINRRFGRVGTLPVPRWLVRWGLGPAAKIVAEGIPLRPRFLTQQGYRFCFASFERVLSELTNYEEVQFGPANIEGYTSDYLSRCSPKVAIHHTCEVEASLEDVFAFFSRPENLGSMTPPHLRFAIQPPIPIDLNKNSKINYRIHLGKIPMKWSSELESWQPLKRFVDVQQKGPYACWYHEHRFETIEGGGTRVSDTVFYSLPIWSLSRFVERFFVRKQLRYIFAYRGDVMQERFGELGPSHET